MNLSYQAILDDPSLLDLIERQAHRERAEAVHRLIVLPITDFFADRAARAHLARQG